MLEKTLESPLDCREIQPVYPKGNQSWIFIGRTNAEAETLILWLPDEKNWLTRKDLHAGKDSSREERMIWLGGITDAMDLSLRKLWELWMDREILECCSLWCCKESDMTEWLNGIELSLFINKITSYSLMDIAGCLGNCISWFPTPREHCSHYLVF